MNKLGTAQVIWLLLTLLAGFFVFQTVDLKSDISQFLPKGIDEDSALLMKMLQDGPGARVIIVELSHASADELTTFAHTLALKLKKTGHFQKILGTRIPLSGKDSEHLFNYRYLLNQVDLSTDQLHADFQQRLEELSYGTILNRQHFIRDPVNAYLKSLKKLSAGHTQHTHQGVWFSDDNKHAFLLLYSAYPALDLNAQEKAIDTIHDVFVRLGHATLQMQLTGPPVMATNSRAAIKDSSLSISLISTLGIILLVYFSFRSHKRVLLISIPLLSGVLAGTTCVLLLFAQIHGITLAFGITIIGIAIDYPIHLYSHGGNRVAARQIRPTLVLSALTTSVGFLALVLSGFVGLKQMGVFAISGIITAALVSHWVLPGFESRNVNLHSAYAELAQKISSLSNRLGLNRILPLLTIVSIAVLTVQYNHLWEQDINRLSPVPEKLHQLDRQIRQFLNAPEPGELLLISADTQEDLLQKSETLSKKLDSLISQSRLSAYDAPSLYLPSQQLQQQRRQQLPDDKILSLQIQQALADLPFQKMLFQPFINDVVASKKLPLLDHAALNGTLLEIRINTLLFTQGGQWHAVIPLKQVNNSFDIKTIADSHQVRYLNTSREISNIMTYYLQQAFTAIVLGLGLIFVILLLAFRSVKRVFFIFFPVLSIVALTMGMLVAIKGQLNLFHVISLLVVIGISLDYFLYADRYKSKAEGFAMISPALLMCSSTTLLVFGVLAFSSIPVLQAIGQTVSTGVILALTFSLASIGTITENNQPDTRIKSTRPL